jgi:plasmid stabilization system protein ParE
MIKFRVIISPEAEDDIEEVYCYIAFEIMCPLTAERYREGILETIDQLTNHADIFATGNNEYLQQLYGIDVRTTRYKKITIVYNIIGDVTYIRRVMASSLIR